MTLHLQIDVKIGETVAIAIAQARSSVCWFVAKSVIFNVVLGLDVMCGYIRRLCWPDVPACELARALPNTTRDPNDPPRIFEKLPKGDVRKTTAGQIF